MSARVNLARVPALRLVLHHRYGASGDVRDLSGHGNEGHVVGGPADRHLAAVPGDGLAFGGTTRVVVPPSPSLWALGAIRIDATVRVDAGKHRRTIVEGFLAMSFFVEPDDALGGTVYTGHHWYGVYSEPGTVPAGRPVDLTFIYDGLVTFLLQVDRRTVAVVERPVGAVRGVEWPLGLNVGGWPDGDRRMFTGTMYELRIWRGRCATDERPERWRRER